MILLDGKALAAKMRAQMAHEVSLATSAGTRPPALAVILAGDDPASRIYVRNKQNACKEVGIISLPFFLSSNISQSELLDVISGLNTNPEVDGILLQLPVPEGLDDKACLEAIAPDKDVDGFHPLNIGRLAAGLPCFEPCTPAGMIELVKNHGFSLNGKKAVVVGRSNIVGKPLAQMLAGKDNNATVTICHSATTNLARECLGADFLFVAAGQPGLISGDMVPEGCIVVDAGINRVGNSICGDVDFEGARNKACAITPVPGGVGPMTIAMLLRNTIKAWRNHLEK